MIVAKALSATSIIILAIGPSSIRAQTAVTLSPSESPTLPPSKSPTTSPTNPPTQSPTVLIGCPPLWTSATGTTYEPGALVSHPDPSTGYAIRLVSQCREAPYNLYCSQEGFEPGTLYSDGAWIKKGKCNSLIEYQGPTMSPTELPTVGPTRRLWEKGQGGCPKRFDGRVYEEGEVVEFDGHVYECKPWPDSARCNQAGWEPAVGAYWEEAWTILGRCDGTIVPTSAPTDALLSMWEKEGCPDAYVSMTAYEEGAFVENDGDVYECKPWPYYQLCGQPGYEPGVDVHFADAWITLGSCAGTIEPTPTATPTYDAWERVGCPPEYDATLQTVYDEGESVSFDEVVYQCKPWPESARCNQGGYEPKLGQYWSDAWIILGSCSGTIAPSVATTIDPWELIGCPEEHDSNEAYVAGAEVSLDGLVYRCKPYPDAGFCNLHSPSNEFGYLGWETLGSCGGTIGPTSSMTTDPWPKYGCPDAFDESLATIYEEGESIERGGVVYKCEPWPLSSRCNQAGWEPGTGVHWEEAWAVLGSCAGTIIPTASPTKEALPIWAKTGCPEEYSDTTSYAEGDTVSSDGSFVYGCKRWPNTGFCNMFAPHHLQFGGLGWDLIGSCGGTIAPTGAPIMADYSSCSAPEYDPDVTYEEGDPVQAKGDIYECKPLPYTLWCNNPSYAPGTAYGPMAWTRKGSC